MIIKFKEIFNKYYFNVVCSISYALNNSFDNSENIFIKISSYFMY